jgi:biopolymer transport protein ExbD
MRFATRRRRSLPESIIPMINVVFLLLIFFLMSARLAPPAAVKVDLPTAESEESTVEDHVLYLDKDGLAVGDLRGDAALQALAQIGPDQVLTLRADAALPGAEVAKALAKLASFGITQVELAVRAK